MTKVVTMNSPCKRSYAEKSNTLTISSLKEKVKKQLSDIRVTIKKLNSEKKRLRNEFDDFLYYYSDKITREGLFGEDKGKGYCGTEVDFIPEEAYDYRIIKKKPSHF